MMVSDTTVQVAESWSVAGLRSAGISAVRTSVTVTLPNENSDSGIWKVLTALVPVAMVP